MSAVSAALDLVRPFASFVVPAVFVGFFVFAAVVVRFRRRANARRAFVGVVVGMMALSVVGLLFVPFVPYALYSQSAPATFQTHEVELADENDHTLLYDGRATTPMTGPSLNLLAQDLAETCNETRVREVGTYLLHEGRTYRENVRDRSFSLFEAVQFPRHNLDFEWTRAKLDGYGRFTQLRIYNVTANVTPDDADVTDRHRQLVIQVSDSNVSYPDGRPSRCS